MRVLLTSEAKFERTPDGTVWGTAAYGCAVWRRYLDVFSGVVMAARVADVSQPSGGSVEASGPGIDFCSLPPYSGLAGFCRRLPAVQAAIGHAVDDCPAVIVRSPSPIAYLTARQLSSNARAYGAHIVGDPDQVFSRGAFSHPLRAPLRQIATSAQAQLSQRAVAVLFVTHETLQRKYPTNGRVYSASDVALDDAAFSSRTPRAAAIPFTLVTVGALDQPYKGTSVLLDAIAQLQRRAVTVRLLVVGGGRLMPVLRERARTLGLESNVDFLGQVDRAGVRRALDVADAFVMPSLTEGLPRALLEAMAKGLPAVASAVGGIPELLPPEFLVAPGRPEQLAGRLEWLITAEAAREAAAERNRSVARAYHEREQAAIRRAFCLSVHDASLERRVVTICA
jgi:glycosyltransferase involved in cell wall biosynthesis